MGIKPPVRWLSEKFPWHESNDKEFIYKAADFYSKFKFKNIEASVGDYVLVSNADSGDPDTVEGCDVARITKLYESRDMDLTDRHRAQVTWFSKPCDLPPKAKHPDLKCTLDNEVVEDHRPFGNDVSIETFFKSCKVLLAPISLDSFDCQNDSKMPTFICRYRLMKISNRSYEIEPIIEAERLRYKLQQQLMLTPKSNKTPLLKSQETPTTPKAKQNLREKLLLTPKTPKSTRRMEDPVTPRTKLQEKLSKLTISRSNSGSVNDLQWKVAESKSTKIVLNRTSLVHKERNQRHIPERSDSDSDFEQPNFVSDSDDDFISGTIRKSAKKRETTNRTPTKKGRPMKSKAQTPLTPIGSKQNNSSIPGTPKTKLLTPSMHERKTPIVSQMRDMDNETECQLPGREEQLSEITSFITSKLVDGSSGCLYISGVPGTGKTATVRVAFSELKQGVEDGDLAPFTTVEINGMQIVEPRQAYVHIYRQLTGKTVAPAQACDLLITRFTKPAPRRTSTVMLVDELDALCTRRQEVIYNLVEWTSHSCARLIVVAIANTMDLPERALAAKVSSRLGHGRMQFPPYTHEQLQRIIQMKLNCDGFLSCDAVQLAARKVSAVSGDARRAIALCTRALELVKQGSMGTGSLGALRAVEGALKEMAAGVSVRAIKCCSEAEKRLLKAAAAEVESTGVEEINGIKVAERACLWSSLGGHGVAGGGAKALWRRLGELRLVSVGAWPRVMLYVSPTDVHYATQDL